MESKKPLVFINIGSNLGDKRRNLSRAVREVALVYGDFELSHVMESDPWGFESPHRFLNVAMVFRSDESPIEILHKLQEIEHRLSPDSHRTPDGGYADRLVDIDIMTIEGVRMQTAELTLPHPHLKERPFFMEPLQELLDQIPSYGEAEACQGCDNSTE